MKNKQLDTSNALTNS